MVGLGSGVFGGGSGVEVRAGEDGRGSVRKAVVGPGVMC